MSRLDMVGPVLTYGVTAEAIVEAIRMENDEVEVEDQGSYLRVLVPGRCSVTKEAIEATLGRPFRFPGELEVLMPAFKGKITLNETDALWEA